MSEPATVDANTQVSHTDEQGRTLSGMGADVDRLAEIADRHAPEKTEPAGPGAVPSAPEGGSVTPAPDEKPTRGRQRYSELAHERDAAKAEAAAAKTERETLARERDELKARLDKPSQTPEPQQAKTPAPSQPVEQFEFPDYDAWLETHPGEDWTKWQREQLVAFGDWRDARSNLDERIAQGITYRDSQRAFDATVSSTRAKGREVYADFDAVLKDGPGAGVSLGPTDQQARQRCAAIFLHPQSEHLQYAIMKDGALAQKLGALDDIGFGMEIARLVPAGNGSAPRAERTPPPAPYQPVNGASVTAQTPSSELARKGFDFDKSGYREKRAAERKAAGRR